MAQTYISQVPESRTCETEYCGTVYKYFCVSCRHYVEDCRCQPGVCQCGYDGRYWASPEERPAMRQKLAEEFNA